MNRAHVHGRPTQSAFETNRIFHGRPFPFNKNQRTLILHEMRNEIVEGATQWIGVNLDEFKEVDIWNDMQRYVLGDSELILFSKMMGREAQIKLNRIVLELINQNKKRIYK